MEKNNSTGRRGFLKAAGLSALGAGALTFLSGKTASANSSCESPNVIEYLPCDIGNMCQSERFDLENRLGKGAMILKSRVAQEGQDYWRQDLESALDERVMQPNEIRLRPETGEVDLHYPTSGGCHFSIYGFASNISGTMNEFFKKYLEKGMAEIENGEIILRGGNLDFIKNEGAIFGPDPEISDRIKLATCLSKGYFKDEDPKHQKLNQEYMSRVLDYFRNTGNGKIVTVINPENDVDSHYPVSIRTLSNDIHSLIHFPNPDDASEMKQHVQRYY